MSSFAPGQRLAFNSTETTASHQLGQRIADAWGREWVYPKAEVAIEQGEAVMSEMAVDSYDNLPAAIAADTQTFTDTGATYVTNGVTANMYLSIDDATGEGQLALIKSVTSETELEVEWITSDDGKLDTALSTDTDYTIFAPWFVELATTDKQVAAIAQVDVAANSYFWGLTYGVGLVRCDTSQDIAVNSPLCVGDTDGQLTLAVNTTVSGPCATGVHDNDLDGTLVPALIHCPGGVTAANNFTDRFGYAPALT